MKTLFKKSLLVLMVMFIAVISLGVTNKVVAADGDVHTLSFASTAQRVSQTTTKQEWAKDGITFVNNKAASTTNVGNYSNPVRLYANSEVVVSCSYVFKSVVFVASSSSYATALKNSIASNTNYSFSASGSNVTVSFTEPVESFTIAKLSAQVRLTSIKVTEAAAVSENEELTNIKTSLDAVEANMSLAYEYNLSEKIVSGENVALNDFSSSNYTNGQEVKQVVEPFYTISFNKGSNNNSPKYYTTGTAVRCYGGNIITIKSPMTIKKIVLTYGSGEEYSNALTANVGSFTTNTWTGESSSVSLTISGSTGHRRIKSIEITMEGTTAISAYSNVEFRIKCGVLNSVSEIGNVEEYGVSVSANSAPVNYSSTNAKKDYYFSDATHNYATISLGDVLNDKARLDVKFSVRAYVVYEGNYYYSDQVKTLSVIDLVKAYYGMAEYKEQVTPLVEVLTSLGYSFE